MNLDRHHLGLRTRSLAAPNLAVAHQPFIRTDNQRACCSAQEEHASEPHVLLWVVGALNGLTPVAHTLAIRSEHISVHRVPEPTSDTLGRTVCRISDTGISRISCPPLT